MRHQATHLALSALGRPSASPSAVGRAHDTEGARPEPHHPSSLPVESGADAGLFSGVEEVLSHYLSQRRAEAAEVDDRFAAEVADLLGDFVLRGGKRLRPAFLWWGWRAGGGDPNGVEAGAVLRAAAALELIQACALVHDDIMDGSPLRRGGPSVHEVFAQRHRAAGLRGDAAAFGASGGLLVGDLALVWAEDLWDSAGLSEEARGRVRPVWRAMRTEMMAGQYLDLYGQAAESCSPESALRVAHLKSGLYTVERPLHLGTAIAGAAPEVTTALRRAGRCTGVAFQLRDDLLGVFGDPSRTGKPAGDDVRQGKRTYLMAMGLRQARALGRGPDGDRLAGALGDPALTAEDLDEVRALLTDLGARAAVEQLIGDLGESARTALEDAAVDPAITHGLSALIRTALGVPMDRGTAPTSSC